MLHQKMNDIVLITPPDVLNNDAQSIMILCASENSKKIINEILTSSDVHLNLYWYESRFDNIEWVINLIKKVNIVFIDIDNCDSDMRTFLSHIIAQPNTFYLTNDGVTPYNLISKNRVYDFVWLENFVRGTNEQTR
jgi:hypothetical protein